MLVKEVELSSIEATAYWWINIIRFRVREIAIYGASNDNEALFAEIFYSFTEIDWRRLYLELVKYISEDVNSYVPRGADDSFNQDTDKNGHKRLNDELSKIIGQRIPNIRLVSDDVKDSVIYTTTSNASVWYKSCGVTKLSTKYESSYIITGDSKSLDFYNLLLSTIVVLDKENSDFKSVSILREVFCNEYIKTTGIQESLNNIIELFDFSFNKVCDREIILGSSYEETYFACFRDIDLIGLDSYMSLANHYASVILQKNNEKSQKLCKKNKNFETN